MSIKISVVGASGRMGQLALSLIEQSPNLSLHSALTSKNALSETLGSDLVLDFTNPEVSVKVVDFAIENDQKLVVGTSGWTKEKLERVGQKIAASNATVTIIPNFSIGSVLASKFAAEASKYFDQIEITETHHPKKLDAPSGTALYTSQVISEARNGRPATAVTEGNQAPVFNGIPITSLRIEGAHAEQEVSLAQPDELLYLKHSVTSHQVYAKGMLLSIEKTILLSGLTVGLLSLLEEK